MGSEDDNSDYDLHGVRSRRSWGRCSSSPTSHLGEEMDGLRSSPIGLMDEEIVFPPVALCQSPEPEDFGQMESLDLSPISSRSLQQSSVVADKENGMKMTVLFALSRHCYIAIKGGVLPCQCFTQRLLWVITA